MTSQHSSEHVDYYFDPLCPWAWITSLWIREVRRHRSIEIDWKFFSLAGINDREDKWHGPLRICALAREQGGNDATDRAYLALGRLFHESANSFDQIDDLATVARPYLSDVGLDPNLGSQALTDLSTLEAVMNDHRHAADNLKAFGVPWLVVDGDDVGFFGPVISEALQGEEAAELWDHFKWMATRPYLHELKRGGRKKLQDLAGLSSRYTQELSPAR